MVVLRVFFVPVGRTKAILASIHHRVQGGFDLLGGIPQIHVVDRELERGKEVLFLRVKVVVHCDIADAVLWEIAFRIIAGFTHITAKAGEVFGNDHVYFRVRFQRFDHGLKARTVKVAAGVVVVRKFPRDHDVVFLAVVLQDFSLICDTAGFALALIFIGKPQINKCDIYRIKAFH